MPSRELTIPGEGVKIKQAYQALGVARGWEPTPAQRLRIWCTSLPGEGKTNFVMSNPRAIVLDFEDSARDVVNQQAARTGRSSEFSYYRDIIDQLCDDGPKGSGFEHVAIDTVDRMLDLVDKELTNEWNLRHADNPIETIKRAGKGTGWNLMSDYITGILNALYDAGYGTTVCGHIKPVLDDVGNLTYPPAVFPGLRTALFRDSQIEMTTTIEYEHRRKPKTSKGSGGTVRVPVCKMTVKGVEKLIDADTKARHLEYWDDKPLVLPPGHAWGALEKKWNSITERIRSGENPFDLPKAVFSPVTNDDKKSSKKKKKVKSK